MSAPADVGTNALLGAAFLAFSFGGVTMEHLLLGAGCYMVGAACRFSLKVATALETNQPPNVGRALAALSVSPFLASFASMALYFGAHIIGFEGDAAIGLLLALAGFRGSEGIQKLVALVSKWLPDKFSDSTPAANQENKP